MMGRLNGLKAEMSQSCLVTMGNYIAKGQMACLAGYPSDWREGWHIMATMQSCTLRIMF
jgi:hypothetical protein